MTLINEVKKNEGLMRKREKDKQVVARRKALMSQQQQLTRSRSAVAVSNLMAQCLLVASTAAVWENHSSGSCGVLLSSYGSKSPREMKKSQCVSFSAPHTCQHVLSASLLTHCQLFNLSRQRADT